MHYFAAVTKKITDSTWIGKELMRHRACSQSAMRTWCRAEAGKLETFYTFFLVLVVMQSCESLRKSAQTDGGGGSE